MKRVFSVVLVVSIMLGMCLSSSLMVQAGPPCTKCHSEVSNKDASQGYTICSSCRATLEESLDNKSSMDYKYTINNNGREMTVDEIYKDSGLPSSFIGAEYYDVAMPYNLTAFDIGGWCIESHSSGYVQTAESAKQYKITGSVTRETNLDYAYKEWKGLFGSNWWETIKKSHSVEEDTGMDIVTINGVKFYVTAVQKYQFNYSKANEWFNGFSSASNGYLMDIILTDGTVIHFIKGDSNAASHTNGGATGQGGTGTDIVQGDGAYWKFGATKLMQYANIYGLSSCNSLEVWGTDNSCLSKFCSKYNIGSGENNNRIAYYRIYNLNIDSDFKVAGNGVEEVSYKLGNVTLANGSVSSGVDMMQTGVFAEGEFINVASLVEPKIEFANREDLSDDQLKGVVDWRNNVDYENESGLVKVLRVFVMLFGVGLLIWMVLIYLSYWFDRINNFIDIEFLPIVTSGRLRISPEENECTFNPKSFAKGQAQTVNHRTILTVCFIGLFFSIIIISGTFYTLLTSLIRWILRIIKSF